MDDEENVLEETERWEPRRGPPCSICQHPDIEQIDRALVLGTASYSALGRKYGCDRRLFELHRKRCLLPILQDAQRAAKINIGTDLWEHVTRQMKRIERVAVRAKEGRATSLENAVAAVPAKYRNIVETAAERMAASDARVLDACRSARPFLELAAKLQGQIQEITTINVYASPEMTKFREGLLQILVAHPPVLEEVSGFFAKMADTVEGASDETRH